MSTAVQLAQQLIRVDTAGGNEDRAMPLVAEALGSAGLTLDVVRGEAGRSNLIAKWRGGGALTFAAHMDTVPYDASGWRFDPLGGEIRDDRLYGRGSSDMKAGLAAMVEAAVSAAGEGCRPFSLVITSAEETGCGGGRAVAASGHLSPDPILIIGEATGNRLAFGHKGASWIEVTARGVAAHGSRPDLGVNAIEMLASGIEALHRLGGAGSHERLGMRTTNVGTITGGQQTNLVPDTARMTVDVRTVSATDLDEIEALLHEEQLTTRLLVDVPALWTDPSTSTSKSVQHIVRGVTGYPDEVTAVSYFTDGAVLAGTSARAYILGPGDPDQPHSADEWCSVSRIREASRLYKTLLENWSAGTLE